MSTLNLAKVDTASGEPRYIQAKKILAEAIRNGAFPPGAKLPNTSEIGAQVNVSLITAHKAIQCLVDEGWLRRERGRGTFVRGDYVASVAAKARFRVALVLHPASSLEDFYHGALIAGIHRAAEEGDQVGELVIRRLAEPDKLETIDADGFLCFHPYQDSFPALEEAAKRKAIVVVGGSTKDTSLHCVDSQNFLGALSVVRHLVEMGHHRIAIVNGPLQGTNSLHRFEGYTAGLEASGLPLLDEYVFNAEQAKSAGKVMGRLTESLRGSQRPTAILACGYYLSLDVMTVLQRLNLRIPRDISLAGFDDPKSASLLNPPLTTVRQPLEEMGARAYERMVQLIEGGTPTPCLDLLPTSLILRASTGPAGK